MYLIIGIEREYNETQLMLLSNEHDLLLVKTISETPTQYINQVSDKMDVIAIESNTTHHNRYTISER